MKNDNWHPRNIHNSRYDFKALCLALPALTSFIKKNKYNNEDTIDFANPEAVKTLNKAILRNQYGIHYWDIPKQFLCPPIPGRVDYIHYAADLLKSPTKNENIKVLDIGVGANCVYPLLGHSVYGWQFVGAEFDEKAYLNATKIIKENKLDNVIEIRKQTDSNHFFKNIIKEDEYFDFTICNPPFHSSPEEARAGTERKNRNLGLKNKLNFGGLSHELWCAGGEGEFLRKMVVESALYANQVKWFSSLVSSKENLSTVYGELKRQGAKKVETIQMIQGQKITRFVAWSFRE